MKIRNFILILAICLISIPSYADQTDLEKELFAKSKASGEIEIGVTFEKVGATWIDLTKCYYGNDDDICQGRVNPLDEKYKNPKPIVETIDVTSQVTNKQHNIRTSFQNGMEIIFTDGKPASILVVNPRYVGDGKYCYPLGNDWKCEE